jgi:glycosyltransferase involved in cell wall biosynthesis
MKICAVIPAINEAKTISDVIKGIKALNLDIDVIVIDDGSEDETSLLAEREQAYVIKHAKRIGKGACLKDGFDYALTRGYDIIIALDADGQHEPSDIPQFLKTAKEKNISVVIGNRMGDPLGMPGIRVFTNRLMSSIISDICGQEIPDTQCGFRLFTTEALRSINIKARKFEIDSELLIKLAKKGYKIESLPIRSIYSNQISKIRPTRDTFRFIGFLIKTLFSRR